MHGVAHPQEESGRCVADQEAQTPEHAFGHGNQCPESAIDMVEEGARQLPGLIKTEPAFPRVTMQDGRDLGQTPG